MISVKRITALLLSVIVFLTFASCSKEKDNEQSQEPDSTEKTCAQIIEAVYSKCGTVEFFEMLERNSNKLVTKELSKDESAAYFGTSIEFVTAAASEPEMQPPAYSFCVARMPQGCDMKSTAAAVKEKANPQKWVCTGVSTVYVETAGNVLALIMADEECADALKAVFLTLDSAPETSAAEAEALTEQDMLEIFANIYSGAKSSCKRAENYCGEHKSEMFYEGKMTVAEQKTFFGVELDCEIAHCSMAAMSPDAFFMALIQPKKGADIEKMMTSIADNAHPDWQVCVVAEKVEVASNGGLILVIMGSADETAPLRASFLALKLSK